MDEEGESSVMLECDNYLGDSTKEVAALAEWKTSKTLSSGREQQLGYFSSTYMVRAMMNQALFRDWETQSNHICYKLTIKHCIYTANSGRNDKL